MSIARCVLCACGAWLLAFAPAIAAEQVAKIAYLRGAGYAQMPGELARELKIDLALYSNDRVSTAADSAVRIVFPDATDTWLGSDTIMVIDRYRNVKDDQAFVVNVVKGAFRIVTGAIGRNRPRAVRVSISPASTIGIRGTHFGGEVSDRSAIVVLLEPESGAERSAIEVSNKFGAVFIDEPGYGTEIVDAFSPPSAPRRMQIRSVENLLRSIQSIQRMQVPRLPR